MDALKKVAIVVGIVAGVATIVVAVVAVVTLMMNVATKDDISDLKEQMTTQMTTGFGQVSREISGLRTDVDKKISSVKAEFAQTLKITSIILQVIARMVAIESLVRMTCVFEGGKKLIFKSR